MKIFDNRKHGLTFIEMIMALTIFSLMSIALTTTLIYGFRVNRSELIQLRMTQMARKISNHLEGEVKTARMIYEEEDGNKIRLVIPRWGGGTRTAVFYLQDGDNNPATIGDNRLMFDPDISDNKPAEVLGVYIQPLPGTKIFDYSSAASPLFINMRLGDPTAAPNAPSQAVTGPGFLALVVSMALVPRN